MLQLGHWQYFSSAEYFSITSCINYWQEFSSDMGSRTVKRVGDVSKLRNYQFPQVTYLSHFPFLIIPKLYFINIIIRVLLMSAPGALFKDSKLRN